VAFTSSSGQTRSSLAEIFMITAPVLQSGIDVSVPKTRTVKEITEQRLVLTIDKTQQIFLGDKPVNIHELPLKLRQQGADPAHQIIYLRADVNVPFGAFANLMDAVKQAGITNVSIVTQPLEAKAAPVPGK
jgi:biopolymer transport protein TolR